MGAESKSEGEAEAEREGVRWNKMRSKSIRMEGAVSVRHMASCISRAG